MQQNDQRNEERVVVTGIGMITALGHNVPDTWSAIVAGESGLGEITLFDKELHSSGGACEVKDFVIVSRMHRKQLKKYMIRSGLNLQLKLSAGCYLQM